MTAYSKTPLIKKLGIKAHFKILTVNEPKNYFALLGDLPEGVETGNSELNFIHVFTNKISEVEDHLRLYMYKIVSNGMIWISWYKKSSGKQSEVNEDIIRDTALALGLVDVKVCAFDEEWSALKIVIRKENR